MPISGQCPGCKAILKLSDSFCGKKVRCIKCGKDFLINAGAGALSKKTSPAINLGPRGPGSSGKIPKAEGPGSGKIPRPDGPGSGKMAKDNSSSGSFDIQPDKGSSGGVIVLLLAGVAALFFCVLLPLGGAVGWYFLSDSGDTKVSVLPNDKRPDPPVREEDKDKALPSDKDKNPNKDQAPKDKTQPTKDKDQTPKDKDKTQPTKDKDQAPKDKDKTQPPKDKDKTQPKDKDKPPPADKDKTQPKDKDKGPPKDKDKGPPKDKDKGPPKDKDKGPPKDKDKGPPKDKEKDPPKVDPPEPKPAPLPVVRQKYTDEELTQILEDLKGEDPAKKLDAADRLANAEAIPKRRGDVARALEPLLDAKEMNEALRRSGARALGVWADAQSVPILLERMGPDEKDILVKALSVAALGQAKDPKVADQVAGTLADLLLRYHAGQALRAMGPNAEKAVLKMLEHPDAAVRAEACGILADIGTKASVPALENVAKDPNPRTANAASEALKTLTSKS